MLVLLSFLLITQKHYHIFSLPQIIWKCHQTALVFSLSRLWLIASQTAAYCVCPLPAVEIISNMYFRCDQHKSIYLFKAWDKGGKFRKKKKKLWLDYVILRCVLCRWQLCSHAERHFCRAFKMRNSQGKCLTLFVF